MLTYNNKPSTLAPPLYYAGLPGFQDLTKRLVDNNPKSLNKRGGFWGTPLVAALAKRHRRIAKLLRDGGAELNVHGYDNETPLHSAASHGNLELVSEVSELILDYGADVNVRNVNNWTPLHYACQGFRHPLANSDEPRSFPEVARLLLECGADVDAQTNSSSTPLHIAALSERIEVVRVLLKHGAESGVQNEEGKTALQIAAARGYNKIMDLLSEHARPGCVMA